MRLQFAAPVKLVCPIKNYAWGMRGESSLVAKLSGEEVDPEQPCAELWIGAHPSDSAIALLRDGHVPLRQCIEQAPAELLGGELYDRFGSSLPYLAKVLSIATALSIQTHPSKGAAKLLHQRDPNHYPDVNHKPEIAVALTEVELLWGFRPFADLVDVVESVPEFAELVDKDTLANFLSSKGGSSKLQEFITALVGVEPRKLESACSSLVGRLRQRQSVDRREAWILRLADERGAVDVGYFFFFLLNLAKLSPGEAVFTDAGIVHAYLSGDLFECMANSDNVIRVGLTSKYKDAEALVENLDYSMRTFEPLSPEVGSQLSVYHSTASEFKVSLVHPEEFLDISDPSAQLVCSVDGTGRIAAGELTESFSEGDCWFISAEVQAAKIEVVSGRVFLVSLP